MCRWVHIVEFEMILCGMVSLFGFLKVYDFYFILRFSTIFPQPFPIIKIIMLIYDAVFLYFSIGKIMKFFIHIENY